LKGKKGRLHWTGTADIETPVYDKGVQASRLDQYNSNIHFARARGEKAVEIFGGTYDFKIVEKKEERGLYLTILPILPKKPKKVEKPVKKVVSPPPVFPKPKKESLLSDVGIKFGAGYSAGDFSHLPVISAGLEWQRKIFIEAGFGVSDRTEEIFTPDGPGTLRKRLIFGRIAVFPAKNFPLGIVVGYDRDENRIEEFGRYAVKKEGPSLGLGMLLKKRVPRLV